jgi:hypothetical protein
VLQIQVLAGPPGADSRARRSVLSLDASGKATPERPFWREALALYARPDLRRHALNIAMYVVPYVATLVLMYLALGVSYVLALAIPAAGVLVRTFIVSHDCTQGSFLASERANAWLGTALWELAVLRPAAVRGCLLGGGKGLERRRRRRRVAGRLLPQASEGAPVLLGQHRPAPRAPVVMTS